MNNPLDARAQQQKKGIDSYGTCIGNAAVCGSLDPRSDLFGLVTGVVCPGSEAIAEADLILVVLSLVDMALVGGLLVMVMISGYENFVSQLDIKEGQEKLSWLGKMDSSSLKMKVAASIVAISSIHLLKVFMNAQNIPNDKMMWYVIIHMTFVVSAFGMGVLDKIAKGESAAQAQKDNM